MNNEGKKIVPAVLSTKLEIYISKINFLKQFFDQIHIDIAQYNYTNHINTPDVMNIFDILTKQSNFNRNNIYNIHLMTTNQIDQALFLLSNYSELINFIYLDADLLLKHTNIIDQFKNKLVANIRLEENIRKFIHIIDMCINIQVMCVPLGKQGQCFNLKALKKIKFISENYKNKIIHIDGGINNKTVEFIKNYSSIKIINMGSYLTKTNNPKIIKYRKELIEKILLNKHAL